MKIFNGTQHEINLYNLSACMEIEGGRKLIRKEGAEPWLTLYAGTNLNCKNEKGEVPKEVLESNDLNLPLVGGFKFIYVDPLPEGYDIYIVSNLYKSAVKELRGDIRRLATVSGIVYASEKDLRPCGCIELSVG